MSDITREKAIELLDNLIGMIEDNQDNDYDEAFKMGIKALEQEPCEDAISRQVVLDEWENTTLRGRTEFDQVIMMLPSVKPQTKVGHWIEKEENSAICYCCNRNNVLYGDFCKWCGAKMEGEKE